MDDSTADGGTYRVLARKYRPQTFAELIGQEAMVRTLSNAIASGRIAHAFLLTGTRGVGKTSSARIIARALNCVGADGSGGPTPEPCGQCAHCADIASDRHIDVIEVDAASRTGVDDMRELLEGARYQPVSARCKVCIVDEVHMLSKGAFNALLKTLEEPPDTMRFVLATTEPEKVPVTVRSRCQNFALRPVPVAMLIAHYRAVALAEGVAVEPGALDAIARAAEGSVRDGLSMLDGAIAATGGRITLSAVREMLGWADRALAFDLIEPAMGGDAAGALDAADAAYAAGAEPEAVVRALLDLILAMTKLRSGVAVGDDLAAGDATRASSVASRLSELSLAKAWQLLLKGLAEVRIAPSPKGALDMILVRLAYAAELPSPVDIVRGLPAQTTNTPFVH